MGVLNYLPVINFIAIVIIIIILLIGIFKKKDSFNNVPSGYDNLLLSDSDGNLIPFSLSTLQTDVQEMINASLTSYVKKTDLANYVKKTDLTPYVKNTDLTTKLKDYIKNNQGIYLTAPGAGNYPVIVGDRISDPVKRGRPDQVQDELRKFTIRTA